MSLLGAIGQRAVRALQSSNSLAVKYSLQPPNYMSNRLVNMFGKISQELANKVPERPKRPQSGYNMFYKDVSTKLRSENPEMSIKELAKAIGNQWKDLDPDIKQDLTEESKKRSEEYKQQIEIWRKSLNKKQLETYLLGIKTRKQSIARRRLRSELKRLEYPIRPKSAFNLYIKDALSKRDPTGDPFKIVFKRTANKWKSLTDEEKAPYEESAKSDKFRYVTELERWQDSIKTHDQKDTLDKLTKLKTMSSKSYLTPDLEKVKSKKVVKKKPKAVTKTSEKIKAKPKVSSKSKKSSKPKSTEESKEAKAKKSKKVEDSDSSDE